MIVILLQTFRNPKPELLALLRESGPAGDENGVKVKREEPAKKKSRKDKNVSSTSIHSRRHITEI